MGSYGQGSIGFSPKEPVIPAQIGYTIALGAQALNPADNLTYFFGSMFKTPVVTALQNNVFVPVAGTIKIASINSFATTAGTNEDINMFLRMNGAVDTLIATVGLATGERRFFNNALAIPITVADFFQIKMVCPAWVTNPLNMSFGGWVYIE